MGPEKRGLYRRFVASILLSSPLLCFSLQIALRDSSGAAARKEILRGEHGAITTGKWGRNREEKREEEMPEAQNAPKSDPPPDLLLLLLRKRC